MKQPGQALTIPAWRIAILSLHDPESNIYNISSYVNGRLSVCLDVIIEGAVEKMHMPGERKIKAIHILIGSLNEKSNIPAYTEFKLTYKAAWELKDGRAVV